MALPVPYDIITPDGVAVAIHDAVGDTSCPEQTGRLVELLVLRGVLDAEDLRMLLPQGYEVRTL